MGMHETARRVIVVLKEKDLWRQPTKVAECYNWGQNICSIIESDGINGDYMS